MCSLVISFRFLNQVRMIHFCVRGMIEIYVVLPTCLASLVVVLSNYVAVAQIHRCDQYRKKKF